MSNPGKNKRFSFRKEVTPGAVAVAAVVTVLLGAVRWKVPFPMLLADRFAEGAGYVQIAVAALYGGWLYNRIRDPETHVRYRRFSWIAFCLFFFIQLVLGAFVSEKFLLQGTLHYPFPALIVAGPLYRLEIGFMLVLFLSTVLLTGAGWCSHLCYMGGFDLLAAGTGRKAPASAGAGTRKGVVFKSGLLASVILAALLLRLAGAGPRTANAAALLWGAVSIGIMVRMSRKKGTMVHCTRFCPIGTLVTLLKRVNPVRVKMNDRCTSCLRCTAFCKYGALTREQVLRRTPGPTCTACGDCMAVCRHGGISYRIGRWSPERSRAVYQVATVSLHAAFLMLGRV